MSSNVLCGTCGHFDPKQGDKFFNCTYAKQAGIKYGMQVRADTMSCEAFSASKSKQQTSPQPTDKPTQGQTRAEPAPRGLCNWARIVILAAIILIVLLIAWGAYSCFSGPAPAPTPTPTPTPTASPGPTPTSFPVTPLLTPTPVSIYYFSVGQWATGSSAMVNITSVERTNFYSTPGPVYAPPGMSFIFAVVTRVNKGSSPTPVQATDFSIVDSSGYLFVPQQLANSFYGAFPFTARTLNAGDTVSGKILFVVPEASSALEIRTIFDGHTVGWSLPY